MPDKDYFETFLIIGLVTTICVFVVLAFGNALASSPSVRVKRIGVSLLIVFLGSVLVASYLGLGTGFLAFMFCMVLLLPASLGALLAGFTKQANTRIFFLSLVGFAIFACIVVQVINVWELATRPDYCESWVAELDAYQSHYGDYPKSLSEISPTIRLKPPWALVRGDDAVCGYKRIDQVTFSFEIVLGGMPPVHGRYRSDQRIWIYK